MSVLSYLSKGFRPYFLIISLIFAYAALPALKLQPLDRDESRFMQATTQMFESHDFVRISFQDEPRNKKPVGIHWLQALSVEAFGAVGERNPFPFRMVSLLGASLAACAVFMIGKTLFSAEVGLVAGVANAVTLVLSTEAHIAKTDATLTGFIALSFFALATLRFGEKALWKVILFWFAFGMAFLIKGPVPLMIIGLAILIFSQWDKNFKWQKPLWDWRGLALFAVMILPWFILIGVKTNWQFYMDAISQDLTPKLSGHAETKSTPPGLHLLLSPLLLYPSSILMGFAAWVGFTQNKDARVKFLLSWLIPAWIIFELSPAKLAHYTMPLHGAILLLGAYGLFEKGFKGWQKWVGIGLFIFASLIVVALPIALVYKDMPKMLPSAVVLSGIIGIGSLSAIVLFMINSKYSGVMAIFTALMFSVLFKGQFLPNVPALDVSGRVSNELVKLNLHPSLSQGGNLPPLVGAGYQEPSLIFMTRTDSKLDSIDNAVKFAQNGAPAIIEDSLKTDFANKLAAKGLKFNEIAPPISGLNYSKGDEVTIHIGRIDKN